MKHMPDMDAAGETATDIAVVQETTSREAPAAHQDKKSFSHCVSEIKKVWARGTATTIELARTLRAAKSQLPRGQWTAMWRSGDIPFSKRKGEMLVAIGKSFGDLNAQTSADLPQGWNTLYQLAQLERPTFEKLLLDGTIHRRLTLQQAKELVARFNGRVSRAGRGRSNFRARVQRFTDFVRESFKHCSTQDRDFARMAMSELLEELAFPPSEGGSGQSEMQATVL